MVRFSVFNELSLPFANEINIEKEFISFFQLLQATKQQGLGSLRVSESLKNFEILPNVYLPQFIGQQKDIEFQRKIKSVFANKVVQINSPIIKKGETAVLSQTFM